MLPHQLAEYYLQFFVHGTNNLGESYTFINMREAPKELILLSARVHSGQIPSTKSFALLYKALHMIAECDDINRLEIVQETPLGRFLSVIIREFDRLESDIPLSRMRR